MIPSKCHIHDTLIWTNMNHRQPNSVSVTTGVRPHYTGGLMLLGNQFRAMFMKRILSTYRSWILILIQILIAITFVIIPIIFIRGEKKAGSLPKLPLDLAKFSDPIVLVEDSSNSVYLKNYLDYLSDSNYDYEMTKNTTGTMINMVNLLLHIIFIVSEHNNIGNVIRWKPY